MEEKKTTSKTKSTSEAPAKKTTATAKNSTAKKEATATAKKTTSTTAKKETVKKETKSPTQKTTKKASPEVKKQTVTAKSPKTVASSTKATKVAAKKSAPEKNETEKKVEKKAKPVAEPKVEKETVKKVKTEKKSKNQSKKAEKSENEVKKVDFEPRFTYIEGFNGLQLHTAIYDNVKNPKAVVVIVHGMQEHCARYDNFAKFLNKNGYNVIATDLRGHGHTMKTKEEYGMGEDDIFKECLQDQMRVIDFAKSYNLPIYIFGHSYGSMLTQFLVQMSPLVEKAVLCGTTNGDCMQFKAGSCLISIMSPFKDQDKRGGLSEKLCIQSYGKGFENGNWLTRDEKVFEAYKQDEFCGGSFPFSFYRSLIKNMRKANDGIRKARGKKLFLIAGDKDPVGQQGKQVRKLLKIYLKNNVDAKMKLYSDARHELLNELNKDEVYSDVLKFFEE